MDAARVLLVVLGALIFGGFLAGAVDIWAQDHENVAIVPVGVISSLGLGLMLAAFIPRRGS